MAYSLICVHQQSVTHKEMYPNTTTNKAANDRSTVFMWQPPHSVGRRDITPVAIGRVGIDITLFDLKKCYS